MFFESLKGVITQKFSGGVAFASVIQVSGSAPGTGKYKSDVLKVGNELAKSMQ